MKSALFLVFSFVITSICGFSQFHYRTVATGNWGSVTTWEYFTGGAWVPAIATPNNNDSTITIRNTHTVTVLTAVTVDQVTIDPGGTLQNNAGIAITINNSPIAVGSDFIVNGTFIENGTASTVWNPGATWNLGPNGTYVKTNNSNSNNWQNFYDGGASTMPSTANWIIRRNTAVNPTISTTPLGPGIGAYYPNLIIENNVAGVWVAPAASSFPATATTAYPVIKGNLDIGGSGTSTVDFMNAQVYTGGNGTLVQGNLIIRSGCYLRNHGNGLEVQGNIINSGALLYDANDARKLTFSGGNAQSISGSGTTAIYDLVMNKTSNTLTLNVPIIIDNLATFTNGIINTTSANILVFNNNATVASASNSSFVNGPVRRIGPTALTFPVGKGASYRPIGIGAGGAGPAAFWTETFGTATCASRGTVANGFVSANGTWTQTNGTNGASANQWYISPTEVNTGIGVCSDGCISNSTLTNNSLHVSAIGSLCGTPDCGAAYNAGGAATITDRRIESPVINCTGQFGINLAFAYIGNGENTVDNCVIWYFDGITWSIIGDPPVSGLCGSLCPFSCQGQWTNYSLTLPNSANNNPNVKIAFQWFNNGSAGSDPSFAVDDITLTSRAVFTAEYFPSNPQIPYGNVLAPTLTALSDCEYWILTRDVGTDNRTVTLSWNAASCYNTAFASFQVARHDGISTWQDHDGTPIGSAAGGTITTPLPVTSFSPFAIAYVPIPLPVELIKFDAECNNGKVRLFWQTSAEINNDYFAIEKSNDMIEWKEVKRIDGAGNSNSLVSYETIDSDPDGQTYYRLKQTDLNGETKIFDPVFVNCIGKNDGIKVYPNPSTGIVNIEIPSGSVIEDIEVLSSLGQSVLKLTTLGIKGGTIHPLDLSQLSAGTYYLRILMDGNRITKPLNILK